MLIRNFEIHAPPSPTRYSGHPSTIDIMLSTTRLPIESITTTDDLGSDHLPVLVKLPLNPTRDFNKSKCYTKANWVKYKRFLNQRINNKDFQFPDDFECNDIDTRTSKLSNPTITTIRNYGQSPEYLEEEMLVYLTLSTKGSFL